MKLTNFSEIHTWGHALLIAFSAFAANAQTPDLSAQHAIQQTISIAYDQPDNKVETAPIVVVNHYAIADWIQGEKGGRALLRKQHGRWDIMACGGDGFKNTKNLQEAGISAPIAKALVTQLKKAEQSLAPERVKRFALFGNHRNSRSQTDHPPIPNHNNQGHHDVMPVGGDAVVASSIVCHLVLPEWRHEIRCGQIAKA